MYGGSVDEEWRTPQNALGGCGVLTNNEAASVVQLHQMHHSTVGSQCGENPGWGSSRTFSGELQNASIVAETTKALFEFRPKKTFA